MGSLVGLFFIFLFSLVNMFLWGDGGYGVHLLGWEVPAYSLTWFWIACIAFLYGANYAVDGHSKHPICHVISVWWASNIGMTTLLNAVNLRPVEESGELFLGIPGLVLDFIAQGLVDLASLTIIWVIVARGVLVPSIWLVIFCAYLVSNLFGHSAGAYNLIVGDPDLTARAYDAYMYFTFTIMLIVQAIGSGGDAVLRWSGSSVDIYRDIRPHLSRFASRHFHLF